MCSYSYLVFACRTSCSFVVLMDGARLYVVLRFQHAAPGAKVKLLYIAQALGGRQLIGDGAEGLSAVERGSSLIPWPSPFLPRPRVGRGLSSLDYRTVTYRSKSGCYLLGRVHHKLY